MPKRNNNAIEDICITVGDSVIKTTTSVRNLGAILDSHLDMEHHVNSVCRSCHLQIRHIGKIRQYITETLALSLVNSLVTSRLDYCNSLLFGCSKSVINKLQLVQNTAARLITRSPRFETSPPH